jgi:hypothetical protein
MMVGTFVSGCVGTHLVNRLIGPCSYAEIDLTALAARSFRQTISSRTLFARSVVTGSYGKIDSTC